jgi:hypothetical protein
MRAKLLRLMTLLAIAVVAWYVASGPSLQARGEEGPKPLVPVPASENGAPAAPVNGKGVPVPAPNGNGVPAYPPGAFNYYVHPGPAGLVGAQLYVAPRPTPPLMPHEFLYQHHRVYHTYNPGSGVTRTRVWWH